MADEIEIQQPNKEQIERRAYEIYLARGGEHGSDLSDWIMAEQELRIVRTNPSPPERSNRSNQTTHDNGITNY